MLEKGILDEFVNLIDDVIDFMSYYVRKWDSEKERLMRSPIFFYVHQILLPSSYAIYCDVLIGNLPACFMQLRFMLEALAKCYISENVGSIKNYNVFSKMLSLEDVLEEEKISLSKVLDEFGENIQINDKASKLWHKLSQDWVHYKGFVKRFLDYIAAHGIPPSYSIMVPSDYSDEDIELLTELINRIKEFREILKVVYQNIQQQ
ncbi:MAG: hypothetical protein QXO82_05640 [Candidatus Methanomethylicia archaeon]